MRRRGWIGVVSTLLVAVAVATLHARRSGERIREAARQDTRAVAPDSVALLGRLPGSLRESSGLAVSRAHPGVLWTHNDSGDGPRVYAIDTAAKLVGAWTLRGATSLDWEDVALGRCPWEGSEDCLFVADTGDNLRRRDTLTVWIVPEPDPASSGREVDARRLRFSYPDERHDAEALAVTPEGDLVLVTKGRSGSCVLFVLPRDAVRAAVASDASVVLPPGMKLPFTPDFRVGREVTGAALDDAGATLAARTYTELYFYRWPIDTAWTEAAPPCLLTEVDQGGEGVAWAADGSLLLTAEGSRAHPATLAWIRCPEATAGAAEPGQGGRTMAYDEGLAQRIRAALARPRARERDFTGGA